MAGRNTQQASSRPEGGFSLFESIVVLSIIATFSAVAVPRYVRSVSRYRANAAACRVAADLGYARAQAMAASASRTVTFTVGQGCYQLGGIADVVTGLTPYTVDLSKNQYGASIVAANLGGDAVVVFSGFGRPDSGGSVTVKVGAEQKTVQLDADTGKASVP